MTNNFDTERREAIANRDALAYAKACDEGGYTPEDPALYERGCLEARSLRGDSNPSPPTDRGKGRGQTLGITRNFFDYDYLQGKIEKSPGGYDPNNIFAQTKDKREALIGGGDEEIYDQTKGRYVPTSQASEEAVGRSFQRRYKVVRPRISA